MITHALIQLEIYDLYKVAFLNFFDYYLSFYSLPIFKYYACPHVPLIINHNSKAVSVYYVLLKTANSVN